MGNNDQETFGTRLLALLKQRKLSQRKVAEALGISRTAVNKWTKGGMIDDSNLERLADFFQVDKIWLKYGEYYTNDKEEIPSQHHINDFYIYESNNIVTWDWDLISGDLVYSDNVEQVYGVNIQNNDEFLSLMTEDSRDALLAEYAKIIQKGGAHEIDFKIEYNGESKWIKSRAAGIKGENGKITKIVGISLDNTEKKNEELFLQQRQQFFEFMLANSPQLVVFIDQAGGILASNCEVKQVEFVALQTFLYQFAIESQAQLTKLARTGKVIHLSFQGESIELLSSSSKENIRFFVLKLNLTNWQLDSN